MTPSERLDAVLAKIDQARRNPIKLDTSEDLKNTRTKFFEWRETRPYDQDLDHEFRTFLFLNGLTPTEIEAKIDAFGLVTKGDLLDFLEDEPPKDWHYCYNCETQYTVTCNCTESKKNGIKLGLIPDKNVGQEDKPLKIFFVKQSKRY